MIMADVITLSSDDDDNGDVRIIGEKLRDIRTVKEEFSNPVGDECKTVTDRTIERISTTFLSSSVTISKVAQTSLPIDAEQPAVNGVAHNSEATDDSDDDIICLDSESIIKNNQTNGVGRLKECDSVTKSVIQNPAPKNEPVFIPSDDEKDINSDSDVEQQPDKNGNVHKTSKGSPKPEVILIESEDESNDQNSSEDTRKDDDSGDSEVQVLEDEDLSNGCRAEQASDDDDAGDSPNVEESEPGRSTNQSNQVLELPSSSRSNAQPSASTCSSSANHEVDELSPTGPGNLTEKLLKQLNVKISQSGFSKENQDAVTKKIMKSYSSASEEFTQSQKFIAQVRNLISEITVLMALPNSKDMVVLKQITDKIKEFLVEFQRGSTELTPKLNKLHRMLDKLNRRIAKLEQQEVDSDSEYENPYIMLDRYRKRAVQVYNKIRQLEGKSNHADRLYLQEFIYSGVGPVPIQRALEKYYNKTKRFPDFSEIYKLVQKVNKEKGLGLTPSQVHLTAQDVFTDFGRKLKRRREYDDFLIRSSYMPEGQMIVDPAENDVALQEKLDVNKAIGKTEEDVLREFVMKEASGEGTSKDTDKDNADSSKSDAEHSESEKDGYDSDKPKKVFMDSDEEMDYFGNVEERRRPGSEEPAAKKARIEGEEEEGKETGTTSPKDQPMDVDEPETDPPTKESFLEKCSLKPN